MFLTITVFYTILKTTTIWKALTINPKLSRCQSMVLLVPCAFAPYDVHV